MVIALIPSFAQSIKLSFTSAIKLIVVTIAISGFTCFNISSACSNAVTVIPFFSVFITSPMSFPITSGLTSIAPTISPPFS